MLSVRRKVVSALVYPAVLVALSIVLLTLMIFFIIPKFNEFLVDFGTELPLVTKVHGRHLDVRQGPLDRHRSAGLSPRPGYSCGGRGRNRAA